MARFSIGGKKADSSAISARNNSSQSPSRMKTAWVGPSNERSSKEARMRLRLLAGILFVGCTVNTQPAPQYGPGYQQQGYQQPPPQQLRRTSRPRNSRTYHRRTQQPPPQPSPRSAPPRSDLYTPPPPPPPTDVPATYAEPVYNDVSHRSLVTAFPSLDVFYDELVPYGTWYDDPTYGWVFAPTRRATCRIRTATGSTPTTGSLGLERSVRLGDRSLRSLDLRTAGYGPRHDLGARMGDLASG